MTIGLIGYGRFGRLAARYLTKRTRVVVFDRRRQPLRPQPRSLRRGTLREAASQNIVILAVPISQLRSVLKSIRPHLRPGSMVVDVCTVKVKPILWMKTILPDSVTILGTHPLFGPDSDSGSLAGQQIVLTPVRVSERMLRKIKLFLRREGLAVVVMDADRHDRMIADTILLTHFLGRLIHGAGLSKSPYGTKSYRHLTSIVDVAMNDTLQLLRDIWSFNPHARRLHRSLRRSETRLVRNLEGGARS